MRSIGFAKRIEVEQVKDRHGHIRTLTDSRRHSLCSRRVLFVATMLLAFAGIAVGSMPPSPVPRATVPPSTYGGGLVNTPNPMDRSSNLPVTGNVQGGRHFRGPIPYNAPTTFGAPLGSTGLDSFLRYSGVPQGVPGHPQQYNPFYSPSGTVTTTVPGYSGVFSPSSPRIAGGLPPFRMDQPTDTMAMTEMPELRVYGQRGVIDSGIEGIPQQWPMSRNPDELRDPAMDRPGDPTMSPDEYQQRLEQLRRDIDRIRTDASRMEQNLGADSAAVPSQSPFQDSLRPLQPAPEPDRPRRPGHPPLPGEEATGGTLSAMPIEPGLQLYDPSAATEQPVQMWPDSMEAETDTAARLPSTQRIEETARAFDARSQFFDPSARQPTGVPSTAQDRVNSLMNRLQSDSERASPPQGDTGIDLPTRTPEPAREPIRQTYENAGPSARQQFVRCMNIGEQYMEQGRYDQAVEAFTLASVHIPHAAQAHLRRSHAQLAAGDYLGSAASLARAIEFNTQHALARLNLVEAVGGPDLFVRRIRTLENQAGTGNAPQLQLLLAYVFYQMDRPDAAKAAIREARRGSSSSVAANLLEAALQGDTRTK